jgi:hypothetical protein
VLFVKREPSAGGLRFQSEWAAILPFRKNIRLMVISRVFGEFAEFMAFPNGGIAA